MQRQIAGERHGQYLIYPQGNAVMATPETPFLQIGESKYGKPILDRILTLDTPLETASLCAMVSMDSTMRSNLTVGPPIEVLSYKTGSFNMQRHYRFDDDSQFLRDLKRAWDNKLKEAFHQLPPLALEQQPLTPDSNSASY